MAGASCAIPNSRHDTASRRATDTVKTGELILQFDHLNSRSFNISYGVSELGVTLCKGHHGWKHFTDRNKKLYDSIIREIISPERVTLWDRVEADRKTYTFTVYDWLNIEAALAQELSLFNINSAAIRRRTA